MKSSKRGLLLLVLAVKLLHWVAALPGCDSRLPRASVHAQSVVVRRVYAPYDVPGHEAAVFWFGRVTSQTNYADVRVGYKDEHLFVHVNIIDRRLWYDVTPTSSELTDWDAVSLYLDVPSDAGSSMLPGTFRFDAQLVWWEERTQYQAAYRKDAGTWSIADLPFTTVSGWNGDVPNNGVDDRGWSAYYIIPYASLGLSGAPSQGTTWRMAVVVHDRDDGGGTVLGTQSWPDGVALADATTWGELVFGAPPTYVAPPAAAGSTATIRHGLGGAIVIDADVGGSSTCGDQAAPDYFPTWGYLNYAGKEFLNVQNLGIISEWPCFSKYYVTFPLDAVPSGKAIISATLTLYQFGNAGAGETPGPTPSLIQVSTVAEDWEESSINWNSAPPSVENISTTWVDPLDEAVPWPGIPKEWDVSAAVAEAYASDSSVRLVLYSPAWDLHSGRYFRSSDVGGSGEERPTLAVTWGEPVAQLSKEADKKGADYGEAVTYTVAFRGTGFPITVVDRLGPSVEWLDDVHIEGTWVQPVYSPGEKTLTWEGSPALGDEVRITYSVSVNTLDRTLLVNRAQLRDADGAESDASATVIANPRRCCLPLVLRSSSR